MKVGWQLYTETLTPGVHYYKYSADVPSLPLSVHTWHPGPERVSLCISSQYCTGFLPPAEPRDHPLSSCLLKHLPPWVFCPLVSSVFSSLSEHSCCVHRALVLPIFKNSAFDPTPLSSFIMVLCPFTPLPEKILCSPLPLILLLVTLEL